MNEFQQAAKESARLIFSAGQGYPQEYMETNINQAFAPLAEQYAKLVGCLELIKDDLDKIMNKPLGADDFIEVMSEHIIASRSRITRCLKGAK